MNETIILLRRELTSYLTQLGIPAGAVDFMITLEYWTLAAIILSLVFEYYTRKEISETTFDFEKTDQ